MNFLCILLLGSLLLTGCTSVARDISVVGHEATQSIDSCELIYEPRPHKNAVKTVTPELVQAAKNFSFEEVHDFTEAILPVTYQIARDTVASYGKDLTIVSQEVVRGGYEGITSPSVVLKVSVNNQNGYKALSDLAARIGYVYIQDSTLVICEEVSSEGWIKTTSYELKDKEGAEPFWNERNAALFYGLMIGAFNAPDNLGYTYYPGENSFSTLVGSNAEAQMINALIQWVESMSNESIDIVSSSRELSIFFPHNDWANNPQGESYQESLQSVDVLDELGQYRKRYLQTLNLFINAAD